jgi:hypothetical protein
VSIQIQGPTATFTFSPVGASDSLQATGAAFRQGGTVFAFEITGVTYSGSPTTVKATTAGLVSSATVIAASGGADVTVVLDSAATNFAFGLGHGVVGVQFS